MRLSLICAMIIGVAAGGSAQVRDDYEAILVPVYDSGSGAYGSQWTSVLRIFNGASEPVEFAGPVFNAPCQIDTPCYAPIPPNTAASYAFPPRQSHGTIVYAPKAFREDLQYQLRVRDLSRQLQTWGTEIPLARESEFRSGPFNLLDVPTADEFRLTVRVFSLVAAPSTARVSVYTQPEPSSSDHFPTPELLHQVDVVLNPAPPDFPDFDPIFPIRPAFVRLDNFLAGDPDVRSHTMVRVTIQTTTPGIAVWGFVSVTNNATQHVTTITPQ